MNGDKSQFVGNMAREDSGSWLLEQVSAPTESSCGLLLEDGRNAVLLSEEREESEPGRHVEWRLVTPPSGKIKVALRVFYTFSF